jgi:hypothetical protein
MFDGRGASRWYAFGEKWTAEAGKSGRRIASPAKGILEFRGPLVQEPEDAQYATSHIKRILSLLLTIIDSSQRLNNLPD